jgi:cytochrome b561
MGRLRISTRGLIIAVAVVGFDLATMTQAFKRGQLAHSVVEYAIGFGLVLLLLNLDVLGLYLYYAKKTDSPKGSRLSSTPSPLVILGFYVAVLTIAILSILFFTSGLF